MIGMTARNALPNQLVSLLLRCDAFQPIEPIERIETGKSRSTPMPAKRAHVHE